MSQFLKANPVTVALEAAETLINIYAFNITIVAHVILNVSLCLHLSVKRCLTLSKKLRRPTSVKIFYRLVTGYVLHRACFPPVLSQL